MSEDSGLKLARTYNVIMFTTKGRDLRRTYSAFWAALTEDTSNANIGQVTTETH